MCLMHTIDLGGRAQFALRHIHQVGWIGQFPKLNFSLNFVLSVDPFGNLIRCLDVTGRAVQTVQFSRKLTRIITTPS